MLKEKLLKRQNEDKAASNTVSFLFIIVILMLLVVWFIDISVYFNARNGIQAAAENGARVVAINGGTSTPIANKYGSNPVEVTFKTIPKEFTGDGGVKVAPYMQKITRSNISCGPTRAGRAGAPVYCTVNVTYKGLMSNGLKILPTWNRSVKITGNSVSEVKQ